MPEQSRGHYINGAWHKMREESFFSFNPALDEPIWVGENADLSTVQAAFEAARKALPAWSHLTFEARAAMLKRFVHHVQQHLSMLSRKLSEETGKPLWESTMELKNLPEKLARSIEAFQQRAHETQSKKGSQTLRLQFKPLGVVAVLGVFNLPIHLSHGHIIPALLAGNTVLFKPSELTPAIAEAILQCWHEIGLPPGVLNMVQGHADTAKHMLSQPIQGVYFTGSYQTGMAIQMEMQTRPEVLVALEMGGNNPLIIDEVKHRDAALYHALISAYITAGQRCSCVRRLIIPDTAWGEDFLKDFIEGAKKLKIGAFDTDPAPFMGPVIRRSHALHHLEKQTHLLAQGGKSLLSMQLLDPKGAFLSPGIIDMEHAKRFVDEEIFAPLVQVYRYQHFEEAITLANQTQYGLTAGLFSEDPARYAYFAEHVRAGLLSWNVPTIGGSAQLPFGGLGKSGNHRPSAFFAMDYCIYPVASVEQTTLSIPSDRYPGVQS